MDTRGDCGRGLYRQCGDGDVDDDEGSLEGVERFAKMGEPGTLKMGNSALGELEDREADTSRDLELVQVYFGQGAGLVG